MTNAAAVAARQQQTMREEIEAVRGMIVDGSPSWAECRRSHTGSLLSWASSALEELVAVADAIAEHAKKSTGIRPEQVRELARAREGAFVALSRMTEVAAASTQFFPATHVCPKVHVPLDFFREWSRPAMLLERAVDAIAEAAERAHVTSPLLTIDLVERAMSATSDVARAFAGFHGIECPCSRCTSAARKAKKDAAPLATPAQSPGARPAAIPSTLAGSLALAQERARSVAKDTRSDEGYSFVSSETILAEAKRALEGTGLSVAPPSTKLSPMDRVQAYRLTLAFVVMHVGGEKLQVEREWPIGSMPGKSIEKCAAASSTTALAYFLRDLLLMPRQGEEDAATGQRFAAADSNARCKKIRAAIARMPEWNRGHYEDALMRALGNEAVLESMEAWAEHFLPAPAPEDKITAGSSPVVAPTEDARPAGAESSSQPETFPGAPGLPNQVGVPSGSAANAATPRTPTPGTSTESRPEVTRANEGAPGALTEAEVAGSGKGPGECTSPALLSTPAPSHLQDKASPAAPGPEYRKAEFGSTGTASSTEQAPSVDAPCGDRSSLTPLAVGLAPSNDSCSGSSAIEGRSGAAPSSESESTGAVKPEAERGNGLSPSSTHHDRDRGALPASPREGEGTVSGEAAASGKSVPAASDTAAPSPSVKLTRADVCARLGNDAEVVSWADYLCRVLAPADLMGPIGSEILHRAQDRHGPDLVKAAFKAAGGEFTKGPHPRMKGTTLTCERVHVLLAQLAVASSPRDRASKEPDPIVSEALSQLPSPPNAANGF